MRVLFDTNVILDVLWSREPHAVAAVALVDLVARKELDALLGATSITTLYYLAEKSAGPRVARKHIATLLDVFEIAVVSRVVLADALTLRFKDYEDAVLHEAARLAGATAIVTRDPQGFAGAKLSIYQPAELLNLLRAAS